MLFHPAKVPLKVLSILLKSRLACCVVLVGQRTCVNINDAKAAKTQLYILVNDDDLDDDNDDVSETGAHACFPFFQELKPASKPGSRRGSFNPNNKDDGGDGSEVFICIT